MRNYYEQNHKARKFRKPKIKYKTFLVRDSGHYLEPLFVVKLEDDTYWGDAKGYLWKKRQEAYDDRNDQEIMEEYWQKNNINYVIVDLDDELHL